jgi:hypothetical protein
VVDEGAVPADSVEAVAVEAVEEEVEVRDRDSMSDR